MIGPELQWCAVPDVGEGLPEWRRSAALAADGTVFVPAIIGGVEGRVVVAAMFDGATMVLYRGHNFVPARWLAEACPDEADLCEEIESKVRAFFAGEEKARHEP